MSGPGDTFSVIVPTIGRRTLGDALDSIDRAGLTPEDEVVVVADGPNPVAWYQWHARRLPGKYLELARRTNDFGGSPREHGMAHAQKRWLMFLDDDDGYLPGALETVRGVLRIIRGLQPDWQPCPLLFRMLHGAGVFVWKVRGAMECGNVSSQNIVCPNARGKLGRWGKFYAGDFEFIRDTVAAYGRAEWREEMTVRYGGTNRGAQI